MGNTASGSSELRRGDGFSQAGWRRGPRPRPLYIDSDLGVTYVRYPDRYGHSSSETHRHRRNARLQRRGRYDDDLFDWVGDTYRESRNIGPQGRSSRPPHWSKREYWNDLDYAYGCDLYYPRWLRTLLRTPPGVSLNPHERYGPYMSGGLGRRP